MDHVNSWITSTRGSLQLVFDVLSGERSVRLHNPRMPFTCTALNVLFVGPSDTADLVDVGRQVVDDWNARRARSAGVVMLSRHYSTDTASLFIDGSDGQAVINEQIVDDADIVISIFRSKFGSPTPRAGSGTEEEIERTVAAGKRVHVYFSEEPRPADVDTRQLDKLRTFKTSISDKGLWQPFQDTHNLSNLIRRALDEDYDHFQGRLKLPVPATATTSGPADADQVNLQVRVEGSARYFVDGDALLRKHLDEETSRLWNLHSTQHANSGFAGISLTDSNAAYINSDPLLPKSIGEMDDLLSRWKQTTQAGWEDSLKAIASYSWVGLRFTLFNDAQSFVPDLQVDMTFHGALGVPFRRPSDFKHEKHKMLPPVVSSRHLLNGPILIRRSSTETSPVEWRNRGDDLQVTIHPPMIRPQTLWESPGDDVVLMAKDHTMESVRVTWRSTAPKGPVDLSGEFALPLEAVSAQAALASLLALYEQ
ncbi:hypothetical protein R3Q08_26835 [Rhodococcus erythropolis]|uniref:hypothetical protein n=1 Tax=Rhodococcus erythropolis TaxID=1833 RepID=UPI0029491CE3|nr:hypothetical protein [Rhodococcus erythropolis]MDV6211881.1 hypothetical protein [Rhodococcus erythropolis]